MTEPLSDQSSMDFLQHTPDCFWNRAQPSIDGGEGACCTCGAYEHNMLEAMRLAAPDEGRTDA